MRCAGQCPFDILVLPHSARELQQLLLLISETSALAWPITYGNVKFPILFVLFPLTNLTKLNRKLKDRYITCCLCSRAWTFWRRANFLGPPDSS